MDFRRFLAVYVYLISDCCEYSISDCFEYLLVKILFPQRTYKSEPSVLESYLKEAR